MQSLSWGTSPRVSESRCLLLSLLWDEGSGFRTATGTSPSELSDALIDRRTRQYSGAPEQLMSTISTC
uniref:Putative secreted protein n=1 Tax=Anopheles darlingi TaxID=43151 RepID=A0A2M4D991_ANODA